ncbi:MAG: type 4a pilus biogenesis protein PilO [Gammaproteobacteria bacterium]
MKWDELRDLDLRDINVSGVGDWPPAGKAVVAAIVIVIVLVIGYFLVVRPKLNALNQARTQEVTLRHTFERKQHLAANLDAYKRQLATMRKKFGALLLQLPSETEIPDLLAEVSQTAREDGLAQTLFQPRKEVQEDFYAKKPIAMAYSGSWQQIAKFVSDVAALPRIVTFGNFSVKPAKAGVGAELRFTVTGVTYRYLRGDDVGGHGRKKHK